MLVSVLKEIKRLDEYKRPLLSGMHLTTLSGYCLLDLVTT